MLLVSFYTPCKHKKTIGFLMFSGDIERNRWHEMGKEKQISMMIYLGTNAFLFCLHYHKIINSTSARPFLRHPGVELTKLPQLKG